MLFGEMTEVSGVAFYASELSGILGLGYDAISMNRIPTFIDTADLKTKDFAFYLKTNPEESYMTLPGYDTNIMNPTNLQMHNVVEQRYWSLKLT